MVSARGDLGDTPSDAREVSQDGEEHIPEDIIHTKVGRSASIILLLQIPFDNE
jgi:hypothetical protein